MWLLTFVEVYIYGCVFQTLAASPYPILSKVTIHTMVVYVVAWIKVYNWYLLLFILTLRCKGKTWLAPNQKKTDTEKYRIFTYF